MSSITSNNEGLWPSKTESARMSMADAMMFMTSNSNRSFANYRILGKACKGVNNQHIGLTKSEWWNISTYTEKQMNV